MEDLKDEFLFKTQKVTVKAKKIDGDYYAISSKGNVKLLIEVCAPDSVHLGKIMRAEDSKFLSWLPEEAFKPIDYLTVLKKVKELLNRARI